MIFDQLMNFRNEAFSSYGLSSKDAATFSHVELTEACHLAL